MHGSAIDRIANEITWRWSIRQDLSVARHLREGEEVDGVYGISAATIVDRLFCWLEALGLWERLGAMKGEGVKRQVIAYSRYIVLYFVRCLARLGSQNTLPTHLFSDMALMDRLGFNAQMLQEGITHRGAWRRQGPRKNLPLDPEAMSKNIVKLSLPEVRELVRWVLKQIWANLPVVPKKLLGAIDGTFVEVGKSAKGAGRASRQSKVRTKEGVKESIDTVFGFKMVWLWETSVGLPLSVAFGTAEEDEKKFVAGLLQDAREVLGEQGRLGTVVVDRGFLSGPGLWALKEAGIRFIIPAKHDMRVYTDARRIAEQSVSGWRLHVASRERPAMGRARRKGMQTQGMEVVGVEGLRSFETYAPAEQVEAGEHRHRHRKDFRTNSLNAVVLMREDGREKADLVLLTNGPVDHPFTVFDDYDERSLIENQGHRELKQRWCLESPVQRNAKAAEIHVLFVVMAYAVTQGYRLWEEAQIRQEEGGEASTLGEYVRKLEKENFDKLIVFVGETYGIYYAGEFAMLLGVRLKKPNPRGASNLEELMIRLEGTGGT